MKAKRTDFCFRLSMALLVLMLACCKPAPEPSGPPNEPETPEQPVEPSEPVEPTEPSVPGEPTDPSEPSEPSEPTDPSEPDVPDESVIYNVQFGAISIGRVSSTSVQCKCLLLSDDGASISELGVCYAQTENPVVTDNKVVASPVEGGYFICELADLKANTEYYIRAYAIVGSDVFYSSQSSCRTLYGDLLIRTLEVTDIGETSAESGGEITDDGGYEIVEWGVCYNQNSKPTVTSDTKVVASPGGAGTFTCELTNLSPGKRHVVRAYAITNTAKVIYGQDESFSARPAGSTPKDYIEKGQNIGKSIPVKGKWDGTNETYLHWAPVNCGYEEVGDIATPRDHRTGMFYQWGYGSGLQGGAACAGYWDEIYHTQIKWPSSLSYSSTDKWNENRGPCPEGWRLPTRNEFEVLSSRNNGTSSWMVLRIYAGNYGYRGAEFFGANEDMTAGKGVFFPAVGDMFYGESMLWNYGNDAGYYWSSSLSTGHLAYGLYFFEMDVKGMGVAVSACPYGKSVRCVAE
ncbi:MAG: hypothetical protein HUJ95_05485 [Bacteroidales bacterium]|nr:hypothetical protein [Bacteroidales bacterium]